MTDSDSAAELAYKALQSLQNGEDGVHFRVPSIDTTFELRNKIALKDLKIAFKQVFADHRIPEETGVSKKPSRPKLC